MPISPDAVLVKFYKEALEQLVNSVDRNVFNIPANPRHLVLLADTRRILRRLNLSAVRWAEQMVRKSYGKNVSFVNDFLRAKGYTKKELQNAASYATVHEEVINLLLNDPTEGITPRLLRMSSQLRVSIETFVAQNRLLLKQNRLIREKVAMNVFMGTGSGEARNEVLSALLNKGPRPTEFMGLDAWRGGTAAQSLVDAPYYTVITKKGPRKIHIFDHVQMTATTTENAVRTKARNTRIREVGITLVRISPNPPLTPCVCSLFAGRVFSLDKETSDKTGFPLLQNTPNGGPPFHPYCTHSTLPFIPGMMEGDAVEDSIKNGDMSGTPTVRGGLPKALVGKSFPDAQKYFKARGGMKYAVRQNPQIRSYSGSTLADPEVLNALSNKNTRRYLVNDGTGLGRSDIPKPGSHTGQDVLGESL